jgi:hypothetical protein
VSKTPAKRTLFNVNENESNPLLNDEMREQFHSIVQKLLYASKRARWDLLTLIAFLTKRVMNPRRDDWKKLTRGIQYIRDTQTLGVTLEIQDPIQDMLMYPTVFTKTRSFILGAASHWGRAPSQPSLQPRNSTPNLRPRPS